MIKLEVGKYYLNRKGERVGPLVLDADLGTFRLGEGDKDLDWWFPTGRYNSTYASEYDLVTLWKDKTKWLKEGEYYDYHKALPGPSARAKCVLVIGETAVMVVWRHANPNGAVELENFYTALVNVENENGKFRPLAPDAPPVGEEVAEFPEANVEQPF